MFNINLNILEIRKKNEKAKEKSNRLIIKGKKVMTHDFIPKDKIKKVKNNNEEKEDEENMMYYYSDNDFK